MEIFVGIDIGSTEHSVSFLDKEEREIHDPLTITNNMSGFTKLKTHLFKLEERYDEVFFKVGMEATSNYWRNLLSFLRNLRDRLKVLAEIFDRHVFNKPYSY